ncbi:hypothetical protein B0H14DRAFT_3094391 [Mycena olivaceomarginata]|nr:hypothetical protein B0H14DRAFT_3094391 [Mycena olivaceomarginata]
MPQRSYSHPQPPPGFPQLPYNGPPPKPSHIRVDPQVWQNGSWQINPAYNANAKWSSASTQANQQQQTWVPGQAWHQQRAQEWQILQQQMAAAAAFNPFKRVPRPPSAEYLASKLSDNPLGLSNMVPREELYGPSEDGVAAATPWVWNPRGLQPDDDHAPPMSAPPHGSNPAYARPSQPREMTDPTPQSQSHQRRNTMPTRHSSEPPAERRSSTDTLPTFDRPLDRPRQYQRDGPSPLYQQENFTTARELQPTFSTNIVRTPQHYKTRSSSTGPQHQPPIYAPPAQSRASIDSQLSSRMEQLTTQPNALRSTARGSSSMTDVSSFVDEPSSMLSPLSPLVLPGTERSHSKHNSRALGRQSSVPVVPASSSLSAIPEGPSDPPRRSPHQSPQHDSHSPYHEPRRRSRHTSPAPPGSGSGSGSGSSGPSLTVTPPRANPLPEPPQEHGRHPGFTLPVQRTPPASYRGRVRKGLWNRRGDHLTADGFVVYAPADCAYPEELREYPAETVGYRDHLGTTIGYLPSRPELPESLPRFGQPPRQPYEKFVVYEYIQ